MSRMFNNYSSRASFFFFFFNDTATTEIYTLSLHDALPISLAGLKSKDASTYEKAAEFLAKHPQQAREDRKSTRLNSSHGYISYAVFCLKKKKQLYKSLCRVEHTYTISTSLYRRRAHPECSI